jgi:enoyl-CoA hydratase/carnithine racemase
MAPKESTLLLLQERLPGGVVLLRINRPDVRNALNLALRRELAAQFLALGYQDDVRCIVLTGDEKAFCAGADLNEYVDATPEEIIGRNMDTLWDAIARCPKPVIAAVNGFALGGGCELAMHADIIVAGKSAVFGQPEVRIGLIPGGGATQRLSRAVGKFVAMKMLLTGESMTAATAQNAGLVSEVVPDDEVLPKACNLARLIAGQTPLAVRQIKELVLESMNGSLESGLRYERKAFQLMFSSIEKTKQIRAFLDKRKPDVKPNQISTTT